MDTTILVAILSQYPGAEIISEASKRAARILAMNTPIQTVSMTGRNGFCSLKLFGPIGERGTVLFILGEYL